MIVVFLLFACAAYVLFRVALTDPREPSSAPGRFGLWYSTFVAISPAAFFWAPSSAYFNALTCLSLSAVVTPVLFGAMQTDSKGEKLRDWLFLTFSRAAFAIVLAGPLTWFASWWSIVLLAIALTSFISRMPLWTVAGGSPRAYVQAVIAGLFCAAVLYVLVDNSRITPHTWTDWRRPFTEERR